jgi:hypothetical protein
MKTIEIEKRDWRSFFESFSKRHQGWLVNVDVIGPDLGAQVEAKGIALEGITEELRGNGGDSISINLGGKSDSHLTHAVRSPTHVRLKKTDEGSDETLQIEAEDGTTTLLRFRSAVLPEMVDAIASV